MNNERFQSETQIRTLSGKTIKIIEYIGGGGQGDVYKVDYDGQLKALKWYKVLKNPQLFYENLENNIKKGAPNESFLWMQDLTERKGGSFGYIMDLVPEGYYEISKFLINQVHFVSWKRTVDAALHIVMAFRLLHNRGQSYQDLNDGNFFINPRTGKVLIADNDNVAPNGDNLGIIGKPRYIAPEIVREENMPDTTSDRYALSVILFFLFCYGHPLEGKKGHPFVMTPEKSMSIYGSHPLFIFDQEDHSNYPIQGLQSHTIELWNCLPQYLKDIFLKAFSQSSLIDKQRVTEYDWMKVLVRFRSDIVKCSCGNEVFMQNGENTSCDMCHQRIVPNNRIILDEYAIPAIVGTRLYRMQLGTVNFESALDPIANILMNPENPEDIRIKNLSNSTWKCITPSKKEKLLEPAQMAPVKKGIQFIINDAKFEIQ